MNKLGVGLLACALAACGDDGSSAEDLAGVYEVTAHAINSTGCGNATEPPNDDYSHFSLTPGDFLGQDYVSFGECTSADYADCNDFGLFSAFIEIGGDWKNEIHSSSGGGGFTCSLGKVDGVMTVGEDGSIHIETRLYNEDVEGLTEEECDPDEAERRGTDMPCTELDVVDGAFAAELPPGAGQE
jgi:hypothetical protein